MPLPPSREARQLQDLLRQLFRLDDAASLDAGMLAPRRLEVERRLRERIDGLPTHPRVAGDAELARDVLRDLTTFFSRYRDDGGWAPAISNDGSEVAFHLANLDQIYVKSAVLFPDRILRDPSWPGCLKLGVATAVADRDDAKGLDAHKRRITLAWEDAPVRGEGPDLVVRLRYGPWAGEKGAPIPRQDRLDEGMAARILELAPPPWRAALAGDGKGPAPLVRHLRRVTRGQASETFIHNDLRRFLRRELDFFLKDQVLDLDAVSPALERARAVRALAWDLIDGLHAVEDFRRQLFLKRRFVLRTDWAVTLDRVPRELWPQLLGEKDQIRRWRDLLCVEEEVDLAFLERNPGLPVETSYLGSPSLRDRLVEAVARDDGITGVLVHGEAGQALRLLSSRWGGEVGCQYLDPPYNTDSDAFLYKDGLTHSTWASAVGQILRLSMASLAPHGVAFCSIDDHEYPRLCLLAEHLLGPSNVHPPFIWKRKAGGGDDTEHLAVEHEYVLVLSRDARALSLRRIAHESPAMTAKYNRQENGRRYYLERLDKTSLTWSQEMDYPIQCPDGTWIRPPQPDPARHTTIWRWGRKTVAQRQGELEFLRDKRTGEWRIYTRTWEPDQRGVTPRSLLVDKEHGRNRDGTTELAALFGSKVFRNPKPTRLLKHLLRIGTSQDTVVQDCYAGSGSTGHAVLSLNRETGGERRFLLYEMGDHFDTVLVPRILKATWSGEWKDGRPVRADPVSATYQILHLESFDDTLENVDLLDRHRFATPFDHRIRARVTRHDGSGVPHSAVDETPVDLVETFNLLLGLRVRSRQALHPGPVFQVLGDRRDGSGAWSIRVLVIWRDCAQVDDGALVAHLAGLAGSPIDEVYVNGDHGLPSPGPGGWTVRIIEEEFHRRMFQAAEGDQGYGRTSPNASWWSTPPGSTR